VNAAHIHLLLNHVPVLGAVFGLLLLSYGLLRDDDGVVRAAIGTLAVVGVASVGVYLTGEPAEELVEGLAGVSEAALERHEEAALWAVWGGGALGALAFAGLWIHRSVSVPRSFATALLALTLVVSGLLGWTATLGGEVRHPEIRDGFTPVVEPGHAEESDF